MQIAIEMSLYPLRDQYLSIIEPLVKRLNDRTDVEVITNSMSTQVIGEYDVVMDVLRDEMRVVFKSSGGKCVLAAKILGPLDA